MSYVNGQPRVQMMDLATGQRQIVLFADVCQR
jgi:hypothetical protein